MPVCLLHISLLLVLITQASTCNAQEIILDNNGYVGIVVAIDSHENWTIVSNIQEHFTDASRFLYRSTLYRAYFKKITILVPTSWNKNTRFELSPATNESFLGANIRIAGSNPAQPNKPYVRKYTGCGLEGEFMHLTAKYVLDSDIQQRYEDVGKTIVHEWGHLRYGLFDEYDTGKSGGTEDNPFKCGLHLKGSCESNSNAAATNKCVFVPQEKQDVTASIMYKHTMKDFCDNQGKNEHNRKADNMQNKICRHLSCWEVMRSHRDFNDSKNLPNEPTLNTTPTFKIVKAVVEKIVLVLDKSGSMGDILPNSTISRLEAMVKYTTDFIRYFVPDGTHMGIVSFNSRALIDHHVVEVNDTSKAQLTLALPRVADGGTCIGCGLETGILALNRSENPSGGILILISDGKDNSLWINRTKPELQANYIKVYTVIYTDAADDRLFNLSRDTKGSSYFISGNERDLNAQGFYASILQHALPESYRSTSAVTVKLVALVMPASGSVNATFIVDDTLGINTFVDALYQTRQQEFYLMLISPNGIAHHAPHDNRSTKNTIEIHIPDVAETGEWQVVLYNSTSPQVVQLHVTSRRKTPRGPTFSVNGYLSQSHMNGLIVADPEADMASRTLVVTGGVFFGYAPVLGATVTMVVQKGDMEWTRLLHDDGVGADTLPDDGFYSAYFQEFDGDGKYSVTILASAEANRSYYRVTDYASGSAPVDPQYATNETAYDVFLSPFERFISSGFVTVYNYDAIKRAGDVFPPSRVMDLSIQNINESTAAITWTAVGDDLEQGTAALYDLRYCLSIPEALQSFVNCTPVIGDDITSYVAPSSAGSLERYLWQVPDEALNRTLVLGLRVQDDAGLWSDTSNLISVTMSLGQNATDSTEHEEDVTTSISATESHQDTEKERQKLIIVVVPMVTAVVFILVVTFFSCVVCSNRRPAKPSSKEERAVEAGRHTQSGSAFALY